MAKESRLDAEARLKRGELRALVATASLELGIDIGEVDLVCQLASPRSIAALLQRVGRSGHSLGGTPKGRLFPLSRDDWWSARRCWWRCAAGSSTGWSCGEAAGRARAADRRGGCGPRMGRAEPVCAAARAYPYRDLERAEFDEVLGMLAQGYSTRRGRHGALIHHDAVNHRVTGRAARD